MREFLNSFKLLCLTKEASNAAEDEDYKKSHSTRKNRGLYKMPIKVAYTACGVIIKILVNNLAIYLNRKILVLLSLRY